MITHKFVVIKLDSSLPELEIGKCIVYETGSMKKKATQDTEIQRKDQGKRTVVNSKEMATAAAKVTTAVATPVKRDNSHMSPPDKNVQTKVTVLSPKFKEMFLSSMRKEMDRQNDGYDTDDEVPLSLLRGKKDNKKTKENSLTCLNDSIMITDDLNESAVKTGNPTSSSGGDKLNGVVDTVDDPNEGVADRDDNYKPDITQQERRNEVNEGDGNSKTEGTDTDTTTNNDPDPEKEINREQLIVDPNGKESMGTMMTKLFNSIECINKKLEKLDIVEREVKEMNDSMIKKEDVQRIIQDQLIPVKTSLVSQDLQIKRQQAEIENMDKRIGKRIEALENEMEKQGEVETGLKQQEVEKMIEKAQDQMRKEVGGPETRKTHANEGTGSKTNRNIVIHGMSEDRRVGDISKVQDVAHDIGLSLHRWDVDKTMRLGAYEKGKKRPLKVELVSETTKVDFLKCKRKLKTSELYNDIQVVADEEKETRYAKAILRQAAYLAKQRGDRV